VLADVEPARRLQLALAGQRDAEHPVPELLPLEVALLERGPDRRDRGLAVRHRRTAPAR